ncbi:hypothetical protein [Thermogymnomonas acidicola]|uniref:hypothetical protein n=1 Tax=Thermogymnomonas acidicola TaxID=399579 RepID=UPI0009461C70|nr:hypothetical protein [Thermogymnomonas acidicola]
MTVEDIIREIEERKNRQIEQIRSEYEGLLEKAKQENEERKRRAVEEYEKRKSQQGSMKREQILDEALVQARRMVSEKKDELVKQALARALFYVDNIRASRDYPQAPEEDGGHFQVPDRPGCGGPLCQGGLRTPQGRCDRQAHRAPRYKCRHNREEPRWEP